MPAFKKAWMAKTLAASDFVVAVSAFTRSRVAALPGVRPERVLVFPNGVDSARYRPGLDVSELRGRLGLRDEKVVLTLARVVERKGHDTVIRSLPEVLGVIPDVRYVIAGAADAATMRRLRTLVSELQLGDRVLFTGFVAPHETALFYNLCDVYAMPSRELRSKGDTEGFGITFLEANACGKPVVAGRSGGVMDAVEEGETGLLVDPNDPDAVAGALIRFLAHPGFARKIGEQGRRRVLEAYTWDTISARMFQALREANPDRG
jgi:phosphatidylinositol alpha-1,6-mannosyltransferase